MSIYHMGNLNQTRFESERLRYRPVEIKDVSDIFEYGKDANTCKYLNWGPYSEEKEAEEFVKNKIEKKDLQWVIVHKENEKVIGAIRLYNICINNKSADISYIQNCSYCGKGYMTESVCALLKFVSYNMGLKKIFAYYVEDNIASKNVMERVGMKKDVIYEDTVLIKGVSMKVKRYVYNI